MLIRHAVSGFRNRVYESFGSLFVPMFDAMLPKHQNVLAVLEGGDEGKLLIPAHNIVTDAGDIWYAQKACGEAATNAFNTMVMCSAGTPGKAAVYSGFTAIAGSTKAVSATYPKTADADADNTGDAVNVATWLGSWAKADFNHAAISHGLITIAAPVSGSNLLTGYAFAAPFAKTVNDTLKVFVNHQMLGIQSLDLKGASMEVEHATYAGALPGRNLLRANGGFEVWQRGAGGAADFLFSQGSAANYQIADRWYLLANANQMTEVEQVAGVPVDGGSRYACKITRVNGETGVGQYQLGYALDTDEAIQLRGQRLCLSFQAKALTGFTAAGGRLDFLVSCGTGAPQKRLGGMTGETMPLQGVNQLFLVPNGPAVRAFRTSTVLVDTNVTSACVWFAWTPVGTASGVASPDSLIIDDVQLEIVGSAQQGPSPFERLMFQEELQLCQRHFYKSFHYDIAPAYAVGQNTGELRSTPGFAGADTRAGNGHYMRYPVPMRVVPTIKDFNVEAGSVASPNEQVRNLSLSLDSYCLEPHPIEYSVPCFVDRSRHRGSAAPHRYSLHCRRGDLTVEVIHSLSQGGDRSRNLIRRNGGFEVWQRGTSFALGATSTNMYTADGWYLSVANNQASVVSRVAGLTDGSQFAAKIQRNAGQTGTTNVLLFGFPLDTDEIFPFLNKYARLSFVAQRGANWSEPSSLLGARVRTGSGSPVKYALSYTEILPAPIQIGATLTTTPTRFSFVSTLISALTRQMEVYFAWTPAAGAAGADDSFTIDDVQLEVVESPSQPDSPFERMLFADELLLCQRHFFKTFDYDEEPIAGLDAGGAYTAACGAAGASAGAGRPMCGLRFPVPMRVTPTAVTFNPVVAANIQVRNRNAALDHSATSPVPSSVGARIVSTGPSGGSVGQYISVHLTADAGI